MQYSYTFTNNVARYTIVARNCDQAKRHISKVMTPGNGWIITYNGRWHGEPVKNGKCVQVESR